MLQFRLFSVRISVPVFLFLFLLWEQAKCKSVLLFTYLYFNIIGVVVTGALFYGVEYFVNFAFMDSSISPVQIAILNTAFNVFSTVIYFFRLRSSLKLLPLKPSEAKKEDKKKQPLIDDRLLISPAFAVEKNAVRLQ